MVQLIYAPNKNMKFFLPQAEEYQHMVNLKLDTAGIEERDISQIHSVEPSKVKYKCFSTRSEKVKNYIDSLPQYLILATV